MENIEQALLDLSRTSGDLYEAVSDLSSRIDATERIQTQLKKQQDAILNQERTNDRQRGVNILLGTSLVLDLVLSVVIGFGAYQIDGNAADIRELQNRSTSQDCAETSLWLGLIDDRLSDPEMTPDEEEALRGYRNIFQSGYDSLGCESLVGSTD